MLPIYGTLYRESPGAARMSTDNSFQKLEARVAALEEAKHKLEKNLYAAIAVAVALGAGSVWGGSFVSNLGSRLRALQERTTKLEASSKNLHEAVALGISQIHQAVTDSQQDMAQARLAQVQAARDTIRAAATQAKRQLLGLRTRDIMSILKNGKENLRIHGLDLVNGRGSVVFSLFVRDDDENAQVSFFDSKGVERMAQYVDAKGMPALQFEASHNHANLVLGDYDNTGTPFVQLNSRNGITDLLTLADNQRGGSVVAYQLDGKQVVYLGPDTNSGDGLLNLRSLNPDAWKSFGP